MLAGSADPDDETAVIVAAPGLIPDALYHAGGTFGLPIVRRVTQEIE